jgi:hypothetical protein
VQPDIAVAISSMVIVCVLCGVGLARWIDGRKCSYRSAWILATVTVGALFLWSLLGQAQASARNWESSKLVNPVYDFARSWVMASAQPALFTMRTTEFEPGVRRNATSGRFTHATRPRISNVIIFVLESTPAEYLGVYGSG